MASKRALQVGLENLQRESSETSSSGLQLGVWLETCPSARMFASSSHSSTEDTATVGSTKRVGPCDTAQSSAPGLQTIAVMLADVESWKRYVAKYATGRAVRGARVASSAACGGLPNAAPSNMSRARWDRTRPRSNPKACASSWPIGAV